MLKNKTPEADLENKRGLFFQIGLTIALSVALLVINYETPQPKLENTTTIISGLEFQEIGNYGVDTIQLKPPVLTPTKSDKKLEEKFQKTE